MGPFQRPLPRRVSHKAHAEVSSLFFPFYQVLHSVFEKKKNQTSLSNQLTSLNPKKSLLMRLQSRLIRSPLWQRRRQHPPLENKSLVPPGDHLSARTNRPRIRRRAQETIRPHARDKTDRSPPTRTQTREEGGRDQGGRDPVDQEERGE